MWMGIYSPDLSTTLLHVWMLFWICKGEKTQDGACSMFSNSTSVEGKEHLVSDVKGRQDKGSLDVVRLIGHLGWSSISLLFDSQSEKSAERILLDSGAQLHGVHFIKYNIDDWLKKSEFDDLLQTLHKLLFPHLNFLLIGREDLVVTVLSKVATHDARYNRTTDFRHSSRWLVSTRVNHELLQNIYLLVKDRLDNIVVMCGTEDNVTNTEARNDTFIPEAGGDFSIMTFSRSSTTPQFTRVTVDPPADRLTLLDSIYPNIKYGYNNRTFTVSTLMYAPFTMRRQEGDKVTHEGYCFEVLNLIAEALNFSIHLMSPSDGEWGLENNGSWTGLVGQLQYREVDMVVAPLTMHEDRAKVMDFILPAFHTENVDILYKHEDVSDNDIYIVLKPYKYKVLVCIAATVVGVVIIIFFMEQWAPHLTVDSTKTTDVVCQTTTVRTSSSKYRSLISRILCPRKELTDHIYVIFWRILGTIFKQGVSWNPVTSSARVLMSGWWLLTLVLSAGYSAYLVASLAVNITPKPFRTLQDVVDSTDFKLGIMSTGIIKLIFEKSKRQDFRQAWTKVIQLNQTDPGVLAGSETEHLHKVLEGKYCWIVDVTTAEKSLRQDCDLDTVGVRLSGQQLAIGVPTGSPLQPVLEAAMSAIADSGLLGKWWRRWQKTRTSEMCPVPPSIHPISAAVIMGPIYVAAVGIGAAGLALLLEIVKHKLCGHRDKSQQAID